MQVNFNTNYSQKQNFGALSRQLEQSAMWATKKTKNSKALGKIIGKINDLTKDKVVYISDNFDPENVHGFKEWICVRNKGLMGLLFGRKKLGKPIKHDLSDPINFFKEILDRLKTQNHLLKRGIH